MNDLANGDELEHSFMENSDTSGSGDKDRDAAVEKKSNRQLHETKAGPNG